MTSASPPRVDTTALFWWLLGLTVLEVAAVKLSLAPVVVGVSLVGFAVAKAGLVMAEFMHLRFEHRVLCVIALAPVLLGVALLLGLLPDAAQQAASEPPGPLGEFRVAR